MRHISARKLDSCIALIADNSSLFDIVFQRRDAMKITDRLTGAFGEKHKDDSDDELGDEAQNPEDFEQKQAEDKLAAKAAKKAATSAQAENRHEDHEAVVTVVTRENDSDEDMSEDVSDDDDDDEEEGGRRTGFPFRRQDGDDEEEMERPKQPSSTPYNPNKNHQQAALMKAKLTLRAKDKMNKKGIKGGHAFKKPKITSKKKKIKFGNRKGANRDR